MHDPIPAFSYVILGEIVGLLRNPQMTTATVYIQHVTRFLTTLRNLGLSTTAVAAGPLENVVRIPEYAGRISRAGHLQLDAMMGPIYAQLTNETEARLTSRLETSDVSDKLRQFSTLSHLTDIQKHLCAETIRCIETGAYRAGVVMAWNMAYDFIRNWMWTDTSRLDSFNTVLKAKTDRKGNHIYPVGFTSYDDFYNLTPILGERSVLETMNEAKLLPRVFDLLVPQLNQRNRYAHANTIVPSAEQSRRYIDDLVDMITTAPFV